mmetsp:Transcript_8889/g.26084  ORF Transcript_8889/g.26084 Transcript_8889/m.26084 type:complete len:329 (-) Transcript_8889:39-1025(-)
MGDSLPPFHAMRALILVLLSTVSLAQQDQEALFQQGLRFHKMPTEMKIGKSTYHINEEQTRLAMRVQQAAVKVQELDIPLSEALASLSFGGDVRLSLPLGTVPFIFKNATGEEVMRFLLGMIDFLRNKTQVEKVYKFLSERKNLLINVTATLGNSINDLQELSHQVTDKALFTAILGFFEQTGKTIHTMMDDQFKLLNKTWSFRLPGNASFASMEEIVHDYIHPYISNFAGPDGSMNCSRLEEFTSRVATASKDISSAVLPIVTAFAPNVTEALCTWMDKMAPDLVPTTRGILEVGINTTIVDLQVIAGLLKTASVAFGHLVNDRLCW